MSTDSSQVGVTLILHFNTGQNMENDSEIQKHPIRKYSWNQNQQSNLGVLISFYDGIMLINGYYIILFSIYSKLFSDTIEVILFNLLSRENGFH